MKDVGIPSGIKDLGYTKENIPQIITRAIKQHRLLSIATKNVNENDLQKILVQSMENWS